MSAQQSPEWFAERCGKATASKISDIVAKTKSGWGASRDNYMAQLIAERLTGQPVSGPGSAAMQWGTDTEPQARLQYELVSGAFVDECGFIPHPTIPMAGASPDGLIDLDGLIEIKCPNTATHIETLLGAEIEKKYLYQMQWQMACTGRKWCDFASFDPRMPPEMQLHVRRVERDDKLLSGLQENVSDFLDETAEKVFALLAKYPK